MGEPSSVSWIKVLDEKIIELELIAQWASITGLGRVRDLCRQAQAEIREEKKRFE